MKVLVGFGSCGIAAGADDVYTQLESWAKKRNGLLYKTGCIGLCYLEPIVDVYDDEYSLRRFVNINPEDVPELMSAIENRKDFHGFGKDQAVLDGNANVVTQHCGVIDPECIEDYINASGYEPLKKVLTTMTPEQLIEEVQISGLRGRGGAGFPTWFKWEAARKEESDEKYVVCNADEGDPGAFMDRSLLEGDPHRILEGMLIAGYAIGAKKGIIYARAEYPLAISRVTKAIEQARERGFLGEHIMGTDFSFDIIIKEGAGAFVCGEETALISSLEGKRGIPSLKPPYPAQHGYLGKPTNINNVETLANIPWIILYGGKTFAQLGTSKGTGTKVFALTGKLKHGGLVEVPMGTTLRKIIFDIGGGIKDDHEFKAVQLGGPSGGCIPAKYLDTPVDYESVNELGAIMGSGGMVVMDDNTCMVEIARYFLDFIVKESVENVPLAVSAIEESLKFWKKSLQEREPWTTLPSWKSFAM